MSLIQGNSIHSNRLVTYAGLSDPGRVRQCNEDYLLILADAGLFAVADGLGGLDAGDVASRAALQQLKDIYSSLLVSSKRCPPRLNTEDCSLLKDMIAAVNAGVYQQKNAMGRNMATTLAMVQLCGGKAAVAHVGDSRVYHWRAAVLSRVTTDHSLVNELFKKGALTASQAEHSPQRHIITRAIGAGPVVTPTVQYRAILPGDILLLCTDGLTNMLSDARIAEIIETHIGDVGKIVDQLVREANGAGGYDNLTVVLLAIDKLEDLSAI